MSKVRKIFGIEYFGVKMKYQSICVQCSRILLPGTDAYAKGAPKSRLTICRKCVMALSDQYQHETYGRLPFSVETPLFIGHIGHTCKNREDGMTPVTAIFRRGKLEAITPVLHCPECGRYFMGTVEYQKHCFILSQYKLYHTLTGKPFPGNADSDTSVSRSNKEPDYPAHVVWPYRKPYQGGGCSGK